MDCPKCTKALREGARFCDHCGASVSTPDANADVVNSAETLRDHDPLIGQTLDSKYELRERLGQGGMGAVYRGSRVHIGDEVAIKVLHRKYVSDTASAERFRREARAAAVLRHPNVVAIYDYGDARGNDTPAYIVMELLEGKSLRGLLELEGRLGLSRAVTLMRDICAGVGAAHRRGAFHRDLKPDNVIVLPPDADGESESVKVVDFGIAKLRDVAGAPSLTETGAVVGTPYYMSPEQCRGEPLDARSDVYSLGAMLFEMLAGTPPFMAESITGVIAKHLFDPPPPLPPELEIPVAVENTVLRALSKDPAHRQLEAASFMRELRAAARQGGQDDVDEVARSSDGSVAYEPILGSSAEGPRRFEQEIATVKSGEDGARITDGDERGQFERTTTHPTDAANAATIQTGEEIRSETLEPLTTTKSEPRNRRVWLAVIAASILLVSGATGAWMLGWTDTQPPPPPTPTPTPNGGANAPAPPAGMVYVAGGDFMMGRDDSPDVSERPAHGATVGPFFIDRYEITRDEFARFAQTMSRRQSRPGGSGISYPGTARQPVTGVSWDDAVAYCQSVDKRLPTEEEWEFAARGPDSRRYPWGNDWTNGMANANGERLGVATVGSYEGKSPCGALDMVGNVWEWTASEMRAYPGGVMPSDLPPGELKVIRGGSYESDKDYATVTYRSGWPARGAPTYDQTGFRCVKDIQK